MVFAAGLGTRMAPLTRTMPKPMVPVAGRPLIDHALALCDGFARRVVNLHHMGDQLARHLAGRDVLLSWETDGLRDTGGGLRQALPLLRAETVATLNTDAVWTGANPFQALRTAWAPDRMDALLLVIPASRAQGHGGAGDFARAANGSLRRGGHLVFTGAQIIKTALLDGIEGDAFSLNLAWNIAASRHRLFGVEHSGGWCDVGHPAAIPLAEELLSAPHV
nr:nucleotidyltransferase family protein [Oceaniglobus trochenteri]